MYAIMDDILYYIFIMLIFLGLMYYNWSVSSKVINDHFQDKMTIFGAKEKTIEIFLGALLTYAITAFFGGTALQSANFLLGAKDTNHKVFWASYSCSFVVYLIPSILAWKNIPRYNIQALLKDREEQRAVGAAERARRVLEKHPVSAAVIEEVVAAVKSA
ncbi:MAG: hypothetical protein M0P73_19205 [Syntrophobacterales bacterium]|jgi:hypothetical protein|nr:hypothetical protein [Syntrophobacterales bacterium]